MTKINWCEKKIIDLYAFNKMYTLRQGNVPIKTIKLIGEKEDIDHVIKMQKECECFEGIKYVTKTDPKEICIEIIIPEGINPVFDFSPFIYQLGFEGIFDSDKLLDKYNLIALLSEKDAKILEDAVVSNMLMAVNDTLMTHFMHFDDNLLHKEDFKWLKEYEVEGYTVVNVVDKKKKKGDVIEVEAVKSESILESVSSESISESVSDSNSISESVSTSESILESESISETEIVSESISESEITSESVSETVSETPAPEKPAKKKDVLAPEPEEEEENEAQNVKDTLTEEEVARNNELLADIKAAYDECIQFITDTCNGSYRIILNKMQECNQTMKYNTQFCLMYLEISSDRKSELYHKLYDLDQKTKEYNEKLIHQVIKLGCWNCNHTWNEDITFAPAGPGKVKCPKCLAERPFNKD